jgi:hypothetical protein
MQLVMTYIQKIVKPIGFYDPVPVQLEQTNDGAQGTFHRITESFKTCYWYLLMAIGY